MIMIMIMIMISYLRNVTRLPAFQPGLTSNSTIFSANTGPWGDKIFRVIFIRLVTPVYLLIIIINYHHH